MIYRSYELTCPEDQEHVDHGRCPEYALEWQESNQSHWPPGHNFLVGDGVGEETFSRRRRELAGLVGPRRVYCDLDGVLADFEAGVASRIVGSTRNLWPAIHRVPRFFEELPWMVGGKEFWQQLQAVVAPLPVTVLTGSTCEKFSAQKRAWCARELGAEVPVICCRTKDKPRHCQPGDLLVDDRTVVAEAWIAQGGTFVLFVPGEERRVLAEVQQWLQGGGEEKNGWF